MTRIVVIICSLVLVNVVSFGVSANEPDASDLCQGYYANMATPPAAAQEWCDKGSYFSWQSTLPQNAAFEPLNIFHVCEGNPEDPAILLIHGYPTSSYDYAPLFERLRDDHYVCALDTPGYGFSDKPFDDFDYSIFDDAQLVDYYIREVVGMVDFTLVTHDKGASVGFALLQIYQDYDERPYTINHHVITNGNVYLPLAQLTVGQQALLNPLAGPLASSLLTGQQLATGIDEFFILPLSEDEIAAYASIFDYQDGTQVQHEIIKYLDERSVNENDWLRALSRSDIPTTIIWGEEDTVSPVAVADEVWANYLEDRASPASYWRIPCAHHYLQVDQPDLVIQILSISAEADSVSEIAGVDCAATRIHHNMGE
ncbi:MAG: alpha/beta hydrolase [Chloroflexi bacterium]|nr:alpha/beta hydrolase [Chloroflexota bacterium]